MQTDCPDHRKITDVELVRVGDRWVNPLGDRPPGERWDGPHFRPLWVGETRYHPTNPLISDNLSLAALEPQAQWRFTLDGYAWLQAGERRVALDPGSVLAITVPYRGEITVPHGGYWHFIAVNLTGPHALRAFKWVVDHYGSLQRLPLDCGLVENVRSLIEGLVASPSWSEHTWSSRVYEWLQLWWSIADRHQMNMRDLLLQQNGGDAELVGIGSGTVKEFAAKLGYSPAYLSRKITSVWHKTPGRALRRARLEEAARLLRNSTSPVGAIGERVGYASSSAFVRAFRREFGATPLDYRHRHGG